MTGKSASFSAMFAHLRLRDSLCKHSRGKGAGLGDTGLADRDDDSPESGRSWQRRYWLVVIYTAAIVALLAAFPRFFAI